MFVVSWNKKNFHETTNKLWFGDDMFKLKNGVNYKVHFSIIGKILGDISTNHTNNTKLVFSTFFNVHIFNHCCLNVMRTIEKSEPW